MALDQDQNETLSVARCFDVNESLTLFPDRWMDTGKVSRMAVELVYLGSECGRTELGRSFVSGGSGAVYGGSVGWRVGRWGWLVKSLLLLITVANYRC